MTDFIKALLYKRFKPRTIWYKLVFIFCPLGAAAIFPPFSESLIEYILGIEKSEYESWIIYVFGILFIFLGIYFAHKDASAE